MLISCIQINILLLVVVLLKIK